MEYTTLYNGVKKPMISFGVLLIPEEVFEQCIFTALEAGYRAFDTAQAYGNEHLLGSALKKSGIPREELFITTKVRPQYYDGNTRQSVLESMEKLQVDYLDLVLLHQPFGDVYAAWRDLEGLYEEGKIRAIGVANFYADRLVDLAYLARIRPMVDQVEVHPLHQREDILEWGKKLGIAIEAWSPFGRGRGGMLENPVLTAIGEKYGKTVAQVILRWDLQRGIDTVAKSANPDRIRQNADIFDFALSDDDMAAIAAMETGVSVFYSHEDPVTVESYAKGILKSR